jgi:hypothetical protein
MRMLVPVSQYTGQTYRDRSGLRTYDARLKVAQYAGDDEIMFAFFWAGSGPRTDA